MFFLLCSPEVPCTSESNPEGSDPNSDLKQWEQKLGLPYSLLPGTAPEAGLPEPKQQLGRDILVRARGMQGQAECPVLSAQPQVPRP